jgi:hypothetical protein
MRNNHPRSARQLGSGTRQTRPVLEDFERYGDITTVVRRFKSRHTAFRDPVLELALSMTKETKKFLDGMLGCFEWLSESETLFAYVVIPVLCVICLYFLGTVFYQLIVDAHPTSASTASELLSIDPDKWFPRA